MNQNNKVLITGAGGQLGYELQRTVPKGVAVLAASRQQLDISSAESVNAFVELKSGPSVPKMRCIARPSDKSLFGVAVP